MKKITIIIAILLIASVGFLIKYQSDNEKLKSDNIKLAKKSGKGGGTIHRYEKRIVSSKE